MEQLHCKNCGASIEHKYTHRCKYCDTVIFSDEEDFSEDDEKELTNIDTGTINADKINCGSISDSSIPLDNVDGVGIYFLKSLIMAFVSLVFIFVVSNLPYIIKIIMEK